MLTQLHMSMMQAMHFVPPHVGAQGQAKNLLQDILESGVTLEFTV